MTNKTCAVILKNCLKITIKNVEDIAPESEINITIEKADGETKEIKANHSLSEEQIEWFKAGSA